MTAVRDLARRVLDACEKASDSHKPIVTSLEFGMDDAPALARAFLQAEEALDEAIEQCAQALYERAMSERRMYSRTPEKFSQRWDAKPYVPPFDGTSRPVDWRDGWRDEALAALRAGRDNHQETGA